MPDAGGESHGNEDGRCIQPGESGDVHGCLVNTSDVVGLAAHLQAFKAHLGLRFLNKVDCRAPQMAP